MAWNVVILGGGFGGLYTARKLEKLLPPASARVTLINDVNFMLYTPLLPGAAGGTLEPRHVVVPLREQLKSTHLKLAHVIGADPSRKQVTIRSPEGDERDADLRPARGHARLHLAHAADPRAGGARASASRRCRRRSTLRNRLVQTLEHAESIDDDEARHSLLTYVFVGAGYAGRRGPRRAAGLRRRRARALPALPDARPALRARRGARPADARDLRGPGRLRGRRAAPPRDRDPARHDDRARLGRLDRALHGRGDPDPHGRLDRGRQAAPDRRRARACRSTTRGRIKVDRVLPGRGLRRRVGDRRRRRGARTRRAPASRRRRRASTRSARAARSAPTSRRRSAQGTQQAVHLQDARRVRRHGPPPGRGGDARDPLARLPGVVPGPHLPPADDAGHPPPRAARGRLDRRPAVRARLVRARPARPPAAARGGRARASRASGGTARTAAAARRTRTCVERSPRSRWCSAPRPCTRSGTPCSPTPTTRTPRRR